MERELETTDVNLYFDIKTEQELITHKRGVISADISVNLDSFDITPKEVIDDIISDLKLVNGTISFSKDTFEIDGVTKYGQKIYVFQTGDFDCYGGPIDPEMDVPIVKLDNNNIINDVEKKYKEFGLDINNLNQIDIGRTDIWGCLIFELPKTRELIMENKIRKSYKITGLVLGNLWGGGSGRYPARTLRGTDKEKIIKEAEEALTDGSLDSGMGFESIYGAILSLTTISKINIDEKEFINTSDETIILGEVSDDEIQKLENFNY